MFRNTTNSYGRITILIHWVSALAVVGLFAVGFWMVDLTYYSTWYKTAPHLHKSFGVLLLMLTLFRLIWRQLNPKPAADPNHKEWEKRAGKLAHSAIYLLLLLIMFSGYLISTADSRGIWVFGWFELPGFGAFIDDQADIAGLIHQYAAYSLVGLALIHALGALKHHFVDKDSTLLRMVKAKRA
ncbi:cytochrome b561 [Shewanella sediminis HAW-EB3]|uniref:Cytochrome b561 n=1 Tax=Shewanella sediminis (strain HAW-EB3) TaxID=425104 RepID=A8FSK4_SHESH|nr:cytochrome b [Shewanella sediminis]ABV35827.1 cytochrome b561 [Shewanella sediminis HAW-EB3]